MLAAEKTKKRTINVRLLRQGKVIEDAFSESFQPGEERALTERIWEGREGARLFVGQIYSNAPGWVRFLAKNSADLPTDIFSGAAGAVIFLPSGERIFAVCLGHAHIALQDDVFERQFGLRVTLNAVPRTRLRSLDLATPDAVTFQKRVQASKDSDLQAFGVDVLRDLARVAGGTPSDEEFAQFVAGKDSLSITCSVDANNLAAKCDQILTEYRKRSYRVDYAWVDNLKVVREKDIIASLNKKIEEAVKALQAGEQSDLHMAPPEIVNYTEGALLHYNGFGSHGRDFHSLSITDYVSELNRCGFSGSIDDIREKHSIKAKNSDSDEFSVKWKVYNCFVFETALGSEEDAKSYVLFSGDWYQVGRDFKEKIDNFFNAIPKVVIVGPTQSKNEKELIDDLSKNRGNLVKLDCEFITCDGVRYGNIESCDFLSDKKEFIHLKDGHSSGPISHLWSQGIVSADAFISDSGFRKRLRAKVKSLNSEFAVQLPKSNEKVLREEYTVVYGIMRKPYADGSLGLPFFSKVSLQAAVERLYRFGFPVAIELIRKTASDNED